MLVGVASRLTDNSPEGRDRLTSGSVGRSRLTRRWRWATAGQKAPVLYRRPGGEHIYVKGRLTNPLSARTG